MNKIIALSLVFLLSACAGTNFSWDEVEKVKPGMSESEVIGILGKPTARKQSGDVVVLAWSHANAFTGAKAVSFKFVDGKVAGSTTVNK